MTPYIRPVDAWISSDFDDHTHRDPPSQEPGVDYACAYGTPIRAAASGVVIDRKITTSGAMGRYITVRLDDGRTTRDIHLSRVDLRIGDRVEAGQIIAMSGASRFGDEWGVGPHVHRTLWAGRPWASDFLDFEAYARGGTTAGTNTTPLEEDDMYSTEDRERDRIAAEKVGQAHQALWNDTSKGAEWPGVLERLDRLEADHRALEHVMDGSEVPADVSARQGGKREPYTRKLGRWIKSLTA